MKEPKVDVSKAFRERVLIDEAIDQAARDAATLHKKLGLPPVVWRDGRVVHIPPEEIDVVNWTHEVADGND